MQAMYEIEIDGEVATLYNKMKLRSTQKWATFKIEGRKKIMVDKKSDPCKTETPEDDKAHFEEMKQQLKAIMAMNLATWCTLLGSQTKKITNWRLSSSKFNICTCLWEGLYTVPEVYGVEFHIFVGSCTTMCI